MFTTKPVGIFCADTHLDLNAWSARPELRYDSMWSFDFLVQKALDLSSVDFLCLAGDIFDVRKPPSEVIRFFRQRVERLSQADRTKQLFFIQGQHCLADPPWPTSVHPAPIHLHEKSVQLRSGQTLYGLDWTPGDVLSDKLKAIPEDCEIFVCHQVWLELMGALRPCEGSFTQIPHTSVVFTGDYHERKVLKSLKGATNQKLTVYSPGSTNMRKIDEPVTKHYYMLLEDGTWAKKMIPTRPVIVETITDPDDLERFLDEWPQRLQGLEIWEELPAALHKPMLWFKFYDDIERALQRMHSVVGDTAFVFPKLLVREDQDEQITLTRRERQRVVESGLAGCLKLLVDTDHESYGTLLRLLQSHDPDAELQQLRQERFVSVSVVSEEEDVVEVG